jgi:hypothetical protein
MDDGARGRSFSAIMFSMEQSPFEAGRMNSRGPGKREAVDFPRLVGSDPTIFAKQIGGAA